MYGNNSYSSGYGYNSGSNGNNGSSGSGSSSSGSGSSNKSRLQQFKNEVASSMNISLNQGYNGDITAREAGSIGGEMVKRMIAYAKQNMGSGSMMN